MSKIRIILTIIFALVFFIPANKIYANVTKISFVEQQPSLSIGQISDPIKVQVEDQNGTTTANETIYLSLNTNSEGEFSSNKDNWKNVTPLASDFATSSIYISSSSASRTFYYRGLVAGSHQITVYAKSKSGVVFDSITQTIKVGLESASTTSETENNDTGSSSDETSTTTNTSSSNTISTKTIVKTVYVSTHSSEDDLSDYTEKTVFEVSAGRQRMAMVGSFIEFDARYTLSKNESCSPYFDWSFGDGFESKSKIAKHIYKYPGEYNVVLNSDCGNYHSVSRTVARVTSPDVSIDKSLDGDLEISNKGKTEINLGEWKIIGLKKVFIFPQDTIINSGNKIILSKEYLDSDLSKQIILKDPDNRAVVSFVDSKPVEKIDSVENSISVAEAEKLAQEYKQKFLAKEAIKEDDIFGLDVSEMHKTASSADELRPQVASVAESINNNENSGFWANLISTPIKKMQNIAHLFYDF